MARFPNRTGTHNAAPVTGRTRWELTLRGRMLAILSSAALCGAWMTGDTNACLATALLLAPLLIDRLWRGRGLPPLDVTVADRRSQAGSLFLETVHLRNTGRRRAAYDLRIIEPRTSTHRGMALIEVLEPGQTTTFEVPARVLRRGHYVERAFVCETSYPLGLLRNRVALRSHSDLIAEPARIALPEHLLRSIQDNKAEPTPRSTGSSHEFYALREYRYGDDARRVHALRSATAGTLIRAETRGEDERDTCVVLDLRRPPGHAMHQTGHHFEWSLGAVATLVDRLRTGLALTCYVVINPVRRYVLAAGADADALLTFLAEARLIRHGPLNRATLHAIAAHRTCLWVPAGGFAAQEERHGLRTVLVTRERRR